jgi:predicted MPP superfamily phosphohydrolase
MTFMTAIPILVRLAEHLTIEKVALVLAWPGYLWMGFIFIFTSLQLSADLIYFLCHLINRMFSRQKPEYISSRTIGRSVLILALSASVYAFIEAGQIRSERVVIRSSKLPASLAQIRIVQISDVHIGLLLQESRLRRIAEEIRRAKPDILISTGDLVDGKLNRDDAISADNTLAALLASIPAAAGKFAVAGNHEVYAGLPQAVAFTRAAGFTMLRNNSVRLTNGVTVTGVDDQAVLARKHADPAVENALLKSVSNDSFHLLLKHRPDIQPESDGRFDLQLSGHVHGGQIFPFNFLVRLKHRIPCGTTTTGKGSRIHVSRGTGTWGPPMRLFAPPEITIIDVVRE